MLNEKTANLLAQLRAHSFPLLCSDLCTHSQGLQRAQFASLSWQFTALLYVTHSNKAVSKITATGRTYLTAKNIKRFESSQEKFVSFKAAHFSQTHDEEQVLHPAVIRARRGTAPGCCPGKARRGAGPQPWHRADPAPSGRAAPAARYSPCTDASGHRRAVPHRGVPRGSSLSAPRGTEPPR